MRMDVSKTHVFRVVFAFMSFAIVGQFIDGQVSAAQATIELKKGGKVRGEIVNQDEKFLTIKVFVGAYLERKIAIADIAAVIAADGKRHELGVTSYSESDEKSSAPKFNFVTPKKEEKKAQQNTLGYMGFRNDLTGHFADADPPTTWHVSKAVWTANLEGKSNASPVYTADKVFCCEEPDSLVCIEKSTGKILWKRTNTLEDAGSVNRGHPGFSWKSTYGYTTPTPLTDGKLIWASFGNGVCVCYDMDGNRKWIQSVNVSGRHHGTAASPCMIDGVFVAYMSAGRGGTYYGFDAITGKEKWRSGNVITQGSLYPLRLGNEGFVLSSGGTMFNARSGAIKHEKLNEAECDVPGNDGYKGHNWGATVLIHDYIAYFNNHYNHGTGMVAFDLKEHKVKWVANTGGRLGASPVLLDGILYVARDKGGIIVLDISDGSKIYEQEMGTSYSSLVRAGAYIFCISRNGKVTVFKPGRNYQQVSSFDSGFTGAISSMVFDGKVVYFRDDRGLHCVSK